MAKLCSYDVKGLGKKQKRNMIFQWLKDNKVDICLIQEAHYTGTVKESWAKEWEGELFFSGNSSKNAGVGILLNDNLSIKINNMTEILEGRILTPDIVLNETEIKLINIYGPDNDDTAFFKKNLSLFARKMKTRTLLLEVTLLWSLTRRSIKAVE